MRRAVARGRVFPQYFSTDRRYGRLSLKACALFPLMWANADDQGRLAGDPEEIKYAACPNIDHITKADVPTLLEELGKNDLIKLYATSKTKAIQILDWWDVHRPQWAWPSQYPPPEGWKDHLRYKRGAKEVVKENWFSQVSENNAPGEQCAATQVSNKIASGEQSQQRFLTTPKEKERGKRRGRGNSPERSGESPSPSPVALALSENFPKAFGRNPDSREIAYLRDIEKEISAAGATPKQVYDAYGEAAIHNKLHLSYVRAVLLDWLGLERGPP